MPQISFLIDCQEDQQDLVIAQLYELGVDSFLQHEQHLEAFVNAEDHAMQEEIRQYCSSNQLDFKTIAHDERDWNAIWEASFREIIIGSSLQVRASFQKRRPEFMHSLVIAPKMAFGTGHHETTSLILEWMEFQDLKQTIVLDFGCGTGILGIFALLKGAAHYVFVDNDPLATENTQENLMLNALPQSVVLTGGQEVIPKDEYDLILANITRNVLLETIPNLVTKMKPNAYLVLSGFLDADVQAIQDALIQVGMHAKKVLVKSDWRGVIARK